MKTSELWTQEPAQTVVLSESRRAVASQTDAVLVAQRAELARMMNELRQLQESIKQQQGADVPALVRENDEMRRLLQEYEARLTEPAKGHAADRSKEMEELKSENELLRCLLQ